MKVIIVLSTLLGLSLGILRVSNVTECTQCGCLNLDPSSFEQVSYVAGYNDTDVQTNATIFLITQNWYIAVHDIIPNYDDLSVCFAATYTYQGSFQPLVDAMWICMDLDVPYYDVQHRLVIDPDQTTTNPDTGTIFVLYNPSRDIPLVLGCTGCEMSDQTDYSCSGNSYYSNSDGTSTDTTTSSDIPDPTDATSQPQDTDAASNSPVDSSPETSVTSDSGGGGGVTGNGGNKR